MEILISAPATFIIAAALISFLLVTATLHFARNSGMLAYPGRRQSHVQPTPTGGGAGIVATIILLSLFCHQFFDLPKTWMLAVLPGIGMLALIGWVDDRRHVSSLFRLLVQTMSAALLLLILSPGGSTALIWSVLWTVALVGLMNAYNFMDGSDGMAAFEAIFAGLLLTIIFMTSGAGELALLSALLIGSCAGFVPLNFPRARLFMGDSGSVPVGFCLGSLILIGVSEEILRIPEALILLAPFLVDSGLTLLTRVIRRERWYTAHKQHIYQRLIAHGWTHSRVLLLYQAINIVLVAPVLTLARMYPDHAWTFAGLMFLLLSTSWYLASLRLGVRN